MRHRKAFTLIELLIVISVISILTVALVPTFARIQDRARETAVRSLAGRVQVAVESYNMVNGTYPIAADITLKTLFDNYLSVAEVMNSLPSNPFTGKPYAEADVSGKILYTYGADSDNYKISAFDKSGAKTLVELTNMD